MFNNYRGYQYPYQQQQYGYQQPQFQVQKTNDNPIQDIRFVTSEEAKAHIVYPNTHALLIDKAKGIAYLKSADNMGQSTMKAFRYEELLENKTETADFVKKEEFEGVVQQLNFLQQKLSELEGVNGTRETNSVS